MYLIISEFIKWLEVINYSERTIKNYIRTLELFDDYLRVISLGERGVQYPHSIDLENIEQFAEREKLRGKSIRTVNNYLAGIKMFLKFCIHKGLHTMDYRRILFSREPEYKINALDEDEMKMLLDSMKRDQTKPELVRIRDFSIGLYLTYAGLRVGELVDLKVEDLKENMQIVGKGGCRRLVCLHKDYVRVAELYLFLRRRAGIESDYLFVSHSNNSRGKKLSKVSVEQIISKAGDKVGLKVRPHKLRHTCATQMLEHGGNIAYISQILGHKNITTTQTYLDYSDERVRNTQYLIPKI